MPSRETDVVAARQEQSAASKRATFAKLIAKPRAERELRLMLPNGAETEEVTFLFRAIGSQDYDKMLDKHPPNTEQKAAGTSYNIHTFAPALLSRVCVDPELTVSEWKQIWESPDWNRGETMQLFLNAVELCNAGMDIPFTEAG